MAGEDECGMECEVGAVEIVVVDFKGDHVPAWLEEWGRAGERVVVELLVGIVRLHAFGGVEEAAGDVVADDFPAIDITDEAVVEGNGEAQFGVLVCAAVHLPAPVLLP